MFAIFPFRMRFLGRISNRIQNYKKRTADGIEVIGESAFKGGMLGLIVATIVWISIFLYIAFYYLYMPSLSHTRPVHLQFTPCEAEKGVCSFPSAHVQLTKKQQLLMIGQRYKIFISLEMPESPANVDLGIIDLSLQPGFYRCNNDVRCMFMVCARMVDKNGILVTNSCRSTMLHYRSQFLKFLSMCVNSPFYIFGSREEKQTVIVELYSDFEEHHSHPVTDIYVEIQSRFVELYSATMHIQAHLSGLRYLMFHWPLLSAILGVSSNLFLLAFILSLSWYHLYLHHERGTNVWLDFLKRSLPTKFIKRRVLGNKGYVEELSSIPENKTESSGSDNEEYGEFFKPATSEELGFYLDADD